MDVFCHAKEELRHARNGDGVAGQRNTTQRQSIAGIRVAKAKKSNCNAKKFIYA